MGCGEGNLQTDEELGVGYSIRVGWVGEMRYVCSRVSSEWNGVYEGLLER